MTKKYLIVLIILLISNVAKSKDLLSPHKEQVTTQTVTISSEFNTLPVPTGQYVVGVKAYDLIDDSRKMIEYPNGRLVPIWVYFPTKKGRHKSYDKIIDERAYDGFSVIPIWKKLNIKVYSQHKKTINSLKGTGKHPVIIFNHGSACLMSDWGFLFENLASHGYIVITIQNQLKTDTRKPKYLKQRSLDTWAQTIRNTLFVFKWLQDNNKFEFFNTLDLKRMGLMGYSMGANSAKLLAQRTWYGFENKTLFPYDDTSDIKECVVAIDGRRVMFPYKSNIPIFLLINGEREEKQKVNGEYDVMKNLNLKFKH